MSLYDPDFVSAFSQLMQRGGRWRNYEPVELISQWSNLVARCAAGFTGDVEDYFNDLTARSDLEDAMQARELSRFTQMAQLREAVLKSDARFREIIVPDVFPKFPMSQWWNRGVVRYAGHRLVEELYESYGVRIELIVGDSD